MKIKTTQKQIKENYSNVVGVGYCQNQELFKYFEPTFYTSGRYGWTTDVYIFSKNYGVFAISTGYKVIENKNKVKNYAEILDKTERKVKNLKKRFFRMERDNKNLGRFKTFERQIELIQKIIIND